LKLRRFNSDGILAFREFLSSCRQNPDTELPRGMLEDSTLTEVVDASISVADNHFETKGDAARYFESVLRPIRTEELSKDAGLWSWLTLLFFDSVCPAEAGARVVKNDYHYIFEPTNTRHFYRHLLFISWRVLTLAPVHHRLFLHSRLSMLDKMTTEVMKRLYMTRIPCIFEVLDRLYWSESTRAPKKGMIGSKEREGDLTHRLPLRIRQLEMTYDLMSLTADQLIEILGAEFAFARPRAIRLFPSATGVDAD
jgi:hypothetical protein